jgi:hypothetical protein
MVLYWSDIYVYVCLLTYCISGLFNGFVSYMFVGSLFNSCM